MQRLIIKAPALLLALSALSAEETDPLPRVSVVPFINEENQHEYEILCDTATKTIELTLQLIGSYDVIPPIAANPYTNPEILLEYSDEKKLDYVIFGKAYPNEAGQLVFQASVYDTVVGEVALTEERTAESILDTFDTADELVIRLMETFSGIHIGFGKVEFVNNGLDGDYQVFIDEKPVGKNIEFLEKVLNGRRRIEIKQNR